MQTILEYGLVIICDNKASFEKAKQKIDRLGKLIRDSFSKKSAMHMVTVPGYGRTQLFTCSVTNGEVRFGIYDTSKKELRRVCNSQMIELLSENVIKVLINRLENSTQRNILLQPLNSLWKASIEQEKRITDRNGIAFVKDAKMLNVRESDLKSFFAEEKEER